MNQETNNVLGKIINWIGRFSRFLAAIILLSLIVLETIQVILRYCTDLPLFGLEELIQYPALWAYFLGSACASMDRTHIQCGIIGVFVKNQKVLDVIQIMKNILSCIIGAVVSVWSFEYIVYAFKTNKVSVHYNIPIVYAELAILVGLILMTLYTIVETCDDIFNIKQTAKEVK